MKKVALFATILAVAMTAFGSAEAQQFFTQVWTNRLAAGMDGRGVTFKFTKDPQNIQAVKIRDRQNPKGSGALTQDPNNKMVWDLPGNQLKINVTADLPPPPFAATSFADLSWQSKAKVNSLKTCVWQDQNNNVLGSCTAGGGKVGLIMQRDFNRASVILENDGPTSVVFTNIQLYYNQSLDYFNIDNFANVMGVPVTYPDVTLPPASAAIVSFSTPPLDQNSYLYVVAASYTDPNDVYGFGEAITVQSASAP